MLRIFNFLFFIFIISLYYFLLIINFAESSQMAIINHPNSLNYYHFPLISISILERNWQLLEDKNNLEMSINYIKEISINDNIVSQYLLDWNLALKKIQDLEMSLMEQHTVVQVYRSALEKDNKELVKVNK